MQNIDIQQRVYSTNTCEDRKSHRQCLFKKRANINKKQTN